MAAIDDGPVILPNGTKIVRENRATGQVYIVTGDADVRDALPSIDTVMQVLSTEIVEGRNLKVGIDELIVGARGVFKQRYMSQQGTQPEDAKAFTSLYTQAREWARQGCRAEVIDIACRRLNSVQFKAPLNSERVGRLIHEAISAGTAEMYGAFLENDLQSLVVIPCPAPATAAMKAWALVRGFVSISRKRLPVMTCLRELPTWSLC